MEEIVEECNFIIIVYVVASDNAGKKQPNRYFQRQRHSVTQEGDRKFTGTGKTVTTSAEPWMADNALGHGLRREPCACTLQDGVGPRSRHPTSHRRDARIQRPS